MSKPVSACSYNFCAAAPCTESKSCSRATGVGDQSVGSGGSKIKLSLDAVGLFARVRVAGVRFFRALEVARRRGAVGLFARVRVAGVRFFRAVEVARRRGIEMRRKLITAYKSGPQRCTRVLYCTVHTDLQSYSTVLYSIFHEMVYCTVLYDTQYTVRYGTEGTQKMPFLLSFPRFSAER